MVIFKMKDKLMAQYIDKAAVVAEIKRKINEINLDSIEDWRYRLQREHDIEVMKNILSLIDTLEVKEVDLCKEEERIWKDFNMAECRLSKNDLEKISKYFFELGLKVKDK